MAQVKVTAPDGQVYNITAPDGATDAQIQEYVQKNYRDAPVAAPADQTAPPAPKKNYQFGDPIYDVGPAYGAATDAVEKGIYNAGGAVTDAATAMGASPDTAAKAGFATNVGLNAVPMVVGAPARAITGAIQGTARDAMQSALKPTIAALRNGDAATAITTMLDNGINVTRAGVDTLRSKIGELNSEISQAIQNSPAMVNKWDVGQGLKDLLKKFSSQVNPQADMDAIRKAWTEFREHPLLAGKSEMTVQDAQAMKQGTYKQLAGKYGELGSADTEAQKTLARGLKDQIAAKVPDVGALNAQETDLIKTLGVTERRVLMDANKNPGGLAWLTTNPAKFAAFMADRSPLFKSIVARALNTSAEPVGASVGRAVTAIPSAEAEKRGLRDEPPAFSSY